MSAKLHVVGAALAALGLSGCATSAVLVAAAAGVLAFDPHPPSIGGEYRLTAVNGQALPWTGPTDATGRPVTIVSGRLTLGDAVPDLYDDAGGGIPLARSCVQQIPADAGIDAAGMVYSPDGTSYPLSGCGNGRYDLVITRSSPETNETATGRYTWGTAASGTPASYITLVGWMGGQVTRSEPVLIRVQYSGWPDWPNAPVYEFSTAQR